MAFLDGAVGLRPWGLEARKAETVGREGIYLRLPGLPQEEPEGRRVAAVLSPSNTRGHLTTNHVTSTEPHCAFVSCWQLGK